MTSDRELTPAEVEILDLLGRIDRGEETMSPPQEPWHEIYCGDMTFTTASGWTIVVFNDCDSWDYIDHLVAPDGRMFDFDDLPQEIQFWYPEKWERWGWIPPKDRPLTLGECAATVADLGSLILRRGRR